MAIKTLSKQAKREIARWRRILGYLEAGLSKTQIAKMEEVGEEQIRRLVHSAEEARERGWL